MKKVTMQDIADALNISRVTVSKAFNNQPGISEELTNLVYEKAKELGYAKIPYQAAESSPSHVTQRPFTISLVVSRPESSLFWTGIIHRMAQELSRYNINVIYTYVPSIYRRDFVLPSVLTHGNVDCVVVMNVYDFDILTMLNSLSVPKVFLDTVPSLSNLQLSGDVVLIEGYATVQEITSSVIRKGLTDIGFLGDIEYAQTNLERYLGFCQAMKEHRLPVRTECCLTRKIDIFSYEREMFDFLDSLTEWPEAFVCVSDFMAHFVQKYLDEHSPSIKRPVLLTGFDNSSEYGNVAGKITTANVSTHLLGKRLAVQVLFRSENPEAPYDLTFINPHIVYRNTQPPSKNR